MIISPNPDYIDYRSSFGDIHLFCSFVELFLMFQLSLDVVFPWTYRHSGVLMMLRFLGLFYIYYHDLSKLYWALLFLSIFV